MTRGEMVPNSNRERVEGNPDYEAKDAMKHRRNSLRKWCEIVKPISAIISKVIYPISPFSRVLFHGPE